MDEKLKEFVLQWRVKKAQAKPFEGGEIYFVGTIDSEDCEFAQAVADFTERRVLEEIKEEIGISVDCEKCEELEARLALKRKQLEAFLPGGAVERFLIEWNQWDVGEDIPNRLSEAVADLIALLPKKR